MANDRGDQGLGEGPRRVGPEDFDALVREYSAAVAELANRALGWPGDVDDVVQEVFLAAFKGLGRFRGDCQVKTWLFAITMNTCRSHRRRARLRNRFLSTLTPRAEACQAGPDGHVLDTVRKALDRLAPRYRDPAVLWYIQEMDADEICKVLRINRNALHVRLNRARHQLTDLLSGLRHDL